MMTAWLHAAAVLTVAAGLLSAGLAYAATRRLRLSLGVLLDFLTAVGLIRLADDPSWDGIAAAAAVIAIRKLIMTRLGRPQQSPDGNDTRLVSTPR